MLDWMLRGYVLLLAHCCLFGGSPMSVPRSWLFRSESDHSADVSDDELVEVA